MTSLEAEVCFLLQNDFCSGRGSYPAGAEGKAVEPLPSPDIERHMPTMVRTAEALGEEEELASYYCEVLRVARKHRNTFGEIRQYFWLRLWLWNDDEQVHIPFPWYDTYSEIARFLESLAQRSDGQVFWDVDQGRELEVHANAGEFFARHRNPDDDETYATVRLPREPNRRLLD